ncbi:DUF1254 domain-containing protein [Pararhizobium haloflavum]|uniref:DUF1254 domain-containing protein n=1 Tax=Pararhizobium haloflavum TaxID=2037914 RepID=UPI0013001610|nr:DUF1254 domain-containing protein [Pararhizobium haloflavum]
MIFALPFFATGDAWSRVAGLPLEGRFVEAERLGDTETAGLEHPFTTTAICRFEITSQPIHLRAEGYVPFWSLAVFDRQSNEVFSMNDRTAAGTALDVTLATPIQMIGLRESIPPALANSVLVETSAATGYILLRAVVPDASWESSAAAFLDSATCAPVDPAA